MATKDNDFIRAEAELALNEARKTKAEQIKDLGSPIQLTGKALAIQVKGAYAWIAENTAIARKVDLETGKTLQIYKGHTAPVTSLAFCSRSRDTTDEKILITGSWDKTIKLWDTETKEVISTTPAHSDFVKTLFILPAIRLLVSAGSDQIVRLWDLSSPTDAKPLQSVGSISDHTRPVSCIDGRVVSDTHATLYTGDTMGIIKLWDLILEKGVQPPRWKCTLKADLTFHRTRVNDLICGNGQLWTASSDDTAHLHPDEITAIPSSDVIIAKSIAISHPKAVRAVLPIALTALSEPYLLTGSGDNIRVYDLSDIESPELLNELDSHWHDVTALKLWMRTFKGEQDGKTRLEPWIISASLDGTIRKWKLADLLKPPPKVEKIIEVPTLRKGETQFEMTEDEERELAELLDG